MINQLCTHWLPTGNSCNQHHRLRYGCFRIILKQYEINDQCYSEKVHWKSSGGTRTHDLQVTSPLLDTIWATKPLVTWRAWVQVPPEPLIIFFFSGLFQCSTYHLFEVYGWFTEFSDWFEDKGSKVKTNHTLICSDTLDASHMYFIQNLIGSLCEGSQWIIHVKYAIQEMAMPKV